MLSEVSQRHTNTIYQLHVESKKKYNKLVNMKKKEEIPREHTSGY